MRAALLVLLLLIPGFKGFAQLQGTGQIAMLHPSVGNTITKDEKKTFDLFPEKPDNTFESAQLVKYNDSTFTFLFRSINTEIPSEEKAGIGVLISCYYKIEKI